MPSWVSEHIGEIALLIYIFYPLVKRWWDRRKERKARQQAERRREDPASSEQPEKKQRQRPEPRPPAPSAHEAAAPKRATEERPSERDYLDAARARLGRIEAETRRLLARAEATPRLARLVPALREDLLGRVEALQRSLSGTPTLSTVVQDTTVMRGLEELLRYLTSMARQRTVGRGAFLADADAMADACYAPLLELARAQALRLRTSQPVAVTGDWSLSIVPRFASTRVAPLRLPAGFDFDLFRWPAIAHEVAHDFYYSLDGLDEELRERLSLPDRVAVPQSEQELDSAWLRRLFGAWLSEIVADTLGTVMLGPAYVEAMRRAFRDPSSPQRTAAIMQDGGAIDAHPPERLRLYMATRVLHHLGRHEEADAAWDVWEADHPDVRFYYLPFGGTWVGLSDDNLHAVADSLIDVLLQRPWPELEGFQLQSIPGLAYLHAEHATAERVAEALANGETVDDDVRWVMAGAILAAAAQPTLHDRILEAARRSIQGVGKEQKPEPTTRRVPARSIRGELVASVRHPEALREAIVLGATLTRPR